MLKPKARSDGAVNFSSGLLVGVEIERNKTIKKNITPFLPYGDKTVGFNRFFVASQAGIRIDRAVSTDLVRCFKKGMHVELMGYQDDTPTYYKIEQIQEKHDSAPPSLLLSLSEVLVTLYDQRQEEERMIGLDQTH